MSFWHHLPQPIIGLAPMDGVTDAVFRHIVALHGKPDVTFTEFTHVGDICQGLVRGLEPLRYSELERPIIAQLYGKHPELFYQAAQVVCELGFDGLDINMGCPSKNVAASGSGAALIRTPELALQIVEAAHRGIQDWAHGQTLSHAGIKPSLVEAVQKMNIQGRRNTNIKERHPIPLSIKTRLGYDTDIIHEWSECLIEAKPQVISIHGRTLAQMYKGTANWESIAEVSARIQAKGILVLGNGDIQSLQEAEQRIRETPVHGVLIGRAALGNPWIFRGISRLRRTPLPGTDRLQEPFVSLDQRFQLMMDHARLFEAVHEKARFPRMRKHLGWYCSAFPHAAAMRAQMVRTTCSQDVEDILRSYTDSQPQAPSQVLAAALS